MIRVIVYIIFFFINVAITLAQVKSEEVLINNDGVQLPGTLSYTKENTPLLIWIHGSGGVDRTGGQTQYIKQFREEINKNDLAFFSYDKRITNPKNLVFLKEGVLLSDFVDDAKKVIQHFKKDSRFSKIVLIGHSQGSLIGMLISNEVDQFISLAGPGETIDKSLIRQVTNQDAEMGKITATHLKELKETGNIQKVEPKLMVLFAPQNQPFFSEWISLNPAKEIQKVKIPTLIVNGDKDFQVLVKDAEILHKANPKAELAIIKNMTHLCKHIEKEEDNLKSYSSPEYPISQELIKTIVTFIKK